MHALDLLVDVGDGVRRSDGAEEVLVIDDGGEEVDGLRDGQVAGNAQHRRIVGRVVADEEICPPP